MEAAQQSPPVKKTRFFIAKEVVAFDSKKDAEKYLTENGLSEEETLLRGTSVETKEIKSIRIN